MPETGLGDTSTVEVVDEENDIRALKFSNSAINAAIDKELAAAPKDATAVFVATAYRAPGGAITTEMALYVNKRIGDKGVLSFGGFMRGDVKNPLQEVGAQIRATF